MVARRRHAEDIQKFLDRFSRNTPKVRKLNRRQKAKDAKAGRIERDIENEVVAQRFDLEEKLDRMVDEMLDPMHVRGGGWVSDTTPSRLLPKQFNISEPDMRYHPLVQKFYNWDMQAAYLNYERQVLPRMAMHDALGGRPLRGEMQRVNKHFNADIKEAEKIGDIETATRLKNFQQQFARDMKELERRSTRRTRPCVPRCSLLVNPDQADQRCVHAWIRGAHTSWRSYDV